jgi:cobalt-precorrin-5B (C1)-methyltransferase
MIDPVNNFKIPDEWIKLSRKDEKELEALILSGRYVLLSDGSLLRRGYTTGTTAAAAAKASVLSLKIDVLEVSVPTPIGIRIILPVVAKNGQASAIKNSGDHGTDITDGMEITARARINEAVVIKAGQGIGSKKGIPAINPCPKWQIEKAVKEALVETGLTGAHVIISVPDGEKIAEKTLNEQIGITGGISILGTTGFVEPWNEHLGETKKELIGSADRLVLTTGRLGMRFSHMLFPNYIIILIGSDIARGLNAAKKDADVIISGLPGLILKWAFPDILKESGYLSVQELIDADPENHLLDRGLAEAVKLSGRRIVLFDRTGSVLRDSGELP